MTGVREAGGTERDQDAGGPTQGFSTLAPVMLGVGQIFSVGAVLDMVRGSAASLASTH